MSRSLSLASPGVLVIALLALAAPATAAVETAPLSRIDTAVEQAIARHELPGAVVLVLHRGETVYHKAFGQRSRQPTATPMRPDTVFDLASLTKPVATATSILILVEQGKLHLTDRV